MICVVYSKDAARSAIFTYQGIDLHAKVGGLLLLGEFHDEFATFADPAKCGSNSAVDDMSECTRVTSLVIDSGCFFLTVFSRFYDKRDAEDALDAMDGRVLDGRELRVQMARYGRPASPRFGGGRSSYRRRR